MTQLLLPVVVIGILLIYVPLKVFMIAAGMLVCYLVIDFMTDVL